MTTVVGAFGFLLLLGAFGLQLVGRVNNRSTAYSVANLFGAGALAWYAATKDALIFVVLETIWALVAGLTLLWSLWQHRARPAVLESDE